MILYKWTKFLNTISDVGTKCSCIYLFRWSSFDVWLCGTIPHFVGPSVAAVDVDRLAPWYRLRGVFVCVYLLRPYGCRYDVKTGYLWSILYRRIYDISLAHRLTNYTMLLCVCAWTVLDCRYRDLISSCVVPSTFVFYGYRVLIRYDAQFIYSIRWLSAICCPQSVNIWLLPAVY